METQKRELWDRLENEPERAYRAFESFLNRPSGERTLLGAYKQHVGNPEAVKPSDTWSGWSSTFAWRERAAAYDDHLARLRREAYERAIEEEAGRQAREVEKARGRANELLALSYDRAMEWLENAQSSDLRFQDVVSVIRLKMDYLKAFPVQPVPKDEDEWTEEDDELAEEIAKKIIARRDQEEGAQDPDEEVSESDGSVEEDSEDSEDDSEEDGEEER
jgi:transcriptional regulator of met regulon